MAVINTNITSMIAQQNLNSSKSDLTTAMERLSSGLRINSAKDDAAGQAIANRMSAQITGLSQAQRNANDGISIAQTAEGALNQVNDNLQRIRELTVQAQNGTNSDSDLQSIQDEVGQRLNEINRISEQTNFNGVKVLSEGINTIGIQVGANDGESISVNLKTINQNTLNLDGFDLTNTLRDVSASDKNFNSSSINFGDASFQSEANTVAPTSIDSTATAGMGTITFSGTDITGGKNWAVQEFDGTQYAVNTDDNKVYTIDSTSVSSNKLDVQVGKEVTGDLARASGESGNSFSFSNGNANSDYSVVKDSNDNYFVREVNSSGNVSYQTLDTSKISTDGTGSVAIDLSDNTQVTNSTPDMSNYTTDAMKQLDSALKTVDSLRSELGAVQNRFDSAITNLSTNETNLSAARSRIEDADYATEVASMTKNQILQQAGTSVLAQANQLPQSALKLLG